jgi:hypothetical protein
VDDIDPDDLGRDSQTYLFDGPDYWSIYADVYWNAAEAVLLRATADSFLIHPGLFLLRHHAELSLKKFLASAGEPVPTHHDLLVLWQLVGELSTFVDSRHATPKVMREVRNYLAALAELDPGSFTFRYSVGTKGETRGLGGPYSTRDVLAWARHVHDALRNLDGIVDAQYADDEADDEFREEQREMEREMAAEMRSYYADR